MNSKWRLNFFGDAYVYRFAQLARVIRATEHAAAFSRKSFFLDDLFASLAAMILHGGTALRSISCREMRNSFQQKDVLMRKFSLALLAVSGVATADLAPTQTAATQYPFCIQGIDNPGYSGCSYSSLQACQATASGTEAECITSPRYSADNSGAAASCASFPGANARSLSARRLEISWHDHCLTSNCGCIC
jgi:hypothetical protein